MIIRLLKLLTKKEVVFRKYYLVDWNKRVDKIKNMNIKTILLKYLKI